MTQVLCERTGSSAMRLAVLADGRIESSVLDGPIKTWDSAQECYDWYIRLVDELWDLIVDSRVGLEAQWGCWLACVSVVSTLSDLVSDGTLLEVLASEERD